MKSGFQLFIRGWRIFNNVEKPFCCFARQINNAFFFDHGLSTLQSGLYQKLVYRRAHQNGCPLKDMVYFLRAEIRSVLVVINLPYN